MLKLKSVFFFVLTAFAYRIESKAWGKQLENIAADMACTRNTVLAIGFHYTKEKGTTLSATCG